MYPSMVVCAPDLNQKVMMRYLRKMEENAIDAIMIAKADRLSALGKEITPQVVSENINNLNKLLEFYIDAQETIQPLPKLLDGNEIMALLKITPSPILGNIIKALKEAQLSSDVSTKADAINFVKNLYQKIR